MMYNNMVMPPFQQGSDTLDIEYNQQLQSFNLSKVTPLFFGEIEPNIRKMIQEMNIITNKYTSQIKSKMCCMLSVFFCFPCIVCCMIPSFAKLNIALMTELQSVIDNNKILLESNRFTCSITQKPVHKKANIMILEFRRYNVFPNTNNQWSYPNQPNMPNQF